MFYRKIENNKCNICLFWSLKFVFFMQEAPSKTWRERLTYVADNAKGDKEAPSYLKGHYDISPRIPNWITPLLEGHQKQMAFHG